MSPNPKWGRDNDLKIQIIVVVGGSVYEGGGWGVGGDIMLDVILDENQLP